MTIIRSSRACLPVALLLACSTTASQHPPAAVASGAAEARCTRGTLEADIQYGMPLSGPGVDPATGKLAAPPPAGYVVSSTYLALKPGAASAARFQQLLGPVIEELQRQPGLRAVQFSQSAACGSTRTFTVWHDEAAMFAFVSGAAHGHASGGIDEVSRGGSSVAHWKAATLDEATWAYSAQRLAATTSEV